MLSHGSAREHWTFDDSGRLFVNLESMWDDFKESVDHFIDVLAADPRRRNIVLARYSKRVWTVQFFKPVGYAGLSSSLADAHLADIGGVTAVSASNLPPAKEA